MSNNSTSNSKSTDKHLDEQSQVQLIHAHRVRKPGQWIAGLIVALLAAGIIYSLFTNDKYHWNIVGQYLFSKMIVEAVAYTLLLTIMAMVLGIILALTMAIWRQSENLVLRSVSWFYIWFFRGTPIYTQLVFWGLIAVLYPKISLGIPFGPQWLVFDTATLITAFWGAVLGLGLNEGAYLSEIMRSGLNSVDRGQWEAAKALGMKKSTIMRRIVIPQAMRVIVPPTGNETISMLKTTSLVLAVPFTGELTWIANNVGNRLFLPIPMLLVAAIWYLTITSVLMVGQYYLEQYYGRGFTPAKAKKRMTSQKQRSITTSGTVKDDPFIEYTP